MESLLFWPFKSSSNSDVKAYALGWASAPLCIVVRALPCTLRPCNAAVDHVASSRRRQGVAPARESSCTSTTSVIRKPQTTRTIYFTT
eukprot:1270407-Amphidinium_carterae.1